jgi:hypothetical protein
MHEQTSPQFMDIITPEDLAKRLKLSVGTVYNRLGKLSEKDGVVRMGPRCTRINWPLFWQRLCEGKLGA